MSALVADSVFYLKADDKTEKEFMLSSTFTIAFLLFVGKTEFETISTYEYRRSRFENVIR